MRVLIEDNNGKSVELEQNWTMYGEPTVVHLAVKALKVIGYTTDDIKKELEK